ncbi:MAG: alkaline phosphatase family protein [Candidatus Dormibacteria bacterium]
MVVIYQENVSFDHYFGTYPVAANPPGEPRFTAEGKTPSVNGLNEGLLTRNPNAANPSRLDRNQAHTCDQGHDYTAEQNAFDHGLMDRFVESTGATYTDGTVPCDPTQVMNYYDGNTVTGMWNYAQQFAMSDNHYGTGFGPSTPGALNLVTGNTFGATCADAETFAAPTPCGSSALASQSPTPGTPAPQGPGTVYGDPQPARDRCTSRDSADLGGRNVGDLLNARSVTWGWFQGGFRDCTATHTGVGATPKTDYIPHHEPFQYYSSTSNPQHLPPSSSLAVGRQDQANHQYDLSDFWAAVDAGNLPAVSFLKAKGYQDGHAGYSDPLDEQFFLTNTINHLERSRFWNSTAVVIAYDDSDGWYDHQMSSILNQSQTALDTLTDPGQCGSTPRNVPAGPTGPQQARCGYGPRLPLLVVSPFAKPNFVDGHLSDQSSILRFIEDNWRLGRIGSGSADEYAGTLNNMFDFDGARSDQRTGKLFLDPCTGQRASEAQVAALSPTADTVCPRGQ